MFISKQRAILIPQSEHQKLAGTIALLWGNDQFGRPPVDFSSFVAGVAFHDRAYGYLDNDPINGVPESHWMEITRRGFAMTCEDPVAELIIKFHLMRLAGYGSSAPRQAMKAEFAAIIEQELARLGQPAELFQRIDRITNLCDSIAFDFCFEAATQGEVMIFPQNESNEEITGSYEVAGQEITIDPWPLAVESQRGYLVGYQVEGYPGRLEPVIVPYILHRR